MNQKDIEEGLLSSLQTPEQLQTLQSAGITLDDFTAHRETLNFVIDYTKTYQSVPSTELLSQRNGYQWLPSREPFQYWLDELIRYCAARAAQIAVQSFLQVVEESPGKAITELTRQLAKVRYGQLKTLSPTDSAITERFQRYERRKTLFEESNGTHLLGIPTGLEVFDSTHQGWMPGELVGLYARPTVGKTWMLLREGVIAWKAGYRVLLISPEMPVSQIALRIDTLLAAQHGILISHKKLFSGHPDVYEPYKKLTETISNSDRWLTIDSIEGHEIRLSDIMGLQQRFQPDLILIDGISLLEDESKANATWEQMRSLSYGMKNFATAAAVAIIVSHQAVNSRRGQRSGQELAQGRGDDWIMPSLNDAAFGDSFVQAMSTVITMAPDREYSFIRWYSVRKTRERAIVWKPRMSLAWDVDRGRIVDLGRFGDDMEEVSKQLGMLGMQL